LGDPKTETIVASAVQLAYALGLRVVAEGVEDASTLARLEALGCDEAQGYLVAVPMPADVVAAWWRSAAIAGRALLPTGSAGGEVLIGGY